MLSWQSIGRHGEHFIWAAFSVIVDGQTHQPGIRWQQPQVLRTQGTYNVLHAVHGHAVQATGPVQSVRIDGTETVILDPSSVVGSGQTQTQRILIYVAVTADGRPPAARSQVQELQPGIMNRALLSSRWNLSVTHHHQSGEQTVWQPRMMVQHEALFPGHPYCVPLSNLPWGTHWLGLHVQKPELNADGSLQETYDEVVYLNITVAGAVAGRPALPPTWQNN